VPFFKRIAQVPCFTSSGLPKKFDILKSSKIQKHTSTKAIVSDGPKMHHTLFQPLKDGNTTTGPSKEDMIMKALKAIFDICKASYEMSGKVNARSKKAKRSLNEELKADRQCVDEGSEMVDAR
jgi:hypothetical protein